MNCMGGMEIGKYCILCSDGPRLSDFSLMIFIALGFYPLAKCNHLHLKNGENPSHCLDILNGCHL